MQHLSLELGAELDYLRAHYDSWRGWVGRNSWYVLPAIATAFFVLGRLCQYAH